MSLTFEELNERYGLALQALSEIAEAYYFQGMLEESLQVWRSGELILGGAEVDPMERTNFLLTYGRFLVQYYYLTSHEEELMLEVIQRARQGAEGLQDEVGVATALFLSGQALYFQNLAAGVDDYTEARNYFLQSSALRERVDDNFELAESLFYIGLTYDRHGQATQAKEYYLRALDNAEQYGNVLAASEATRHLTDHVDGEQRLHYGMRSLELRNEMKLKRGLPSAQLLLSELYIERGELELALEYCQQAEVFATEMNLQNSLVSVLLTRGDILQKQGAFSEAREYFEKALVLAQQLHIAYNITAAQEKLKVLNSIEQ